MVYSILLYVYSYFWWTRKNSICWSFSWTKKKKKAGSTVSSFPPSIQHRVLYCPVLHRCREIDRIDARLFISLTRNDNNGQNRKKTLSTFSFSFLFFFFTCVMWTQKFECSADITVKKLEAPFNSNWIRIAANWGQRRTWDGLRGELDFEDIFLFHFISFY